MDPHSMQSLRQMLLAFDKCVPDMPKSPEIDARGKNGHATQALSSFHKPFRLKNKLSRVENQVFDANESLPTGATVSGCNGPTLPIDVTFASIEGWNGRLQQSHRAHTQLFHRRHVSLKDLNVMGQQDA